MADKKINKERLNNSLQKYTETVSIRYELMDRILQGLKEGNEHLAIAALRQRNEIEFSGRLQDELSEWKFDLIQMQALIIYTLRNQKVSVLHLESIYQEFLQKIAEAAGIRECINLSEEIIQKYCMIQHDDERRHCSVLIQKILLAVDMDLTQNLTLQYFSERLNVNDAYLSNLFRQEMGITLTEYVTDRRIHQAKELLLTTQNPIKTVAKQVGIIDVHYFSRIFKRKTKMTPSQFRAEHS